MNNMAFSKKDKHIIVNYHYIRDPSPDFSGIHPCLIDEFERQIKFLTENYKVASIEDVYKAAEEKNEERLCAITLDDGTKDHYSNALPILEKYKATAVFFVPTGIFEGILPYTQKIHVLLSKFDIAEIIDNFNDFLKNNFSEIYEKFFIPEDERLSDTKRHDYGGDFRIDNFKEKITSSPKNLREDFIKNFFDKVNISEKDLIKELFIDENEMIDMDKKGFLIGYHTHYHNAIDTLNEKEIEEDLNKSKEYFKRILNKDPDFFSYPYGRSSETAIKVLKENGIRYAVTIERKGVSKNDNPLKIPRYDVNDIKDFLNSQR
ncbi:MAG: polysaccharide deacetylase family protein [Patescibacteria group bacterium]